MSASGMPWRRVLLFAALYLGTGLALAEIAGRVAVSQRFGWRLAGWLVPALIFLGHVRHEQAREPRAPVATACRCALAVALGAAGFATFATGRILVTGSGPSQRMALAIVIWPLLAGIPAFLAAWIGAQALRVLRRSG